MKTKANQDALIEANYAIPIIANDETNIQIVGSCIHCNKSGNYNLLLSGNTSPVIFTLISGAFYPYRVKRLYETSTDEICRNGGIIAINSKFSISDQL